MADPSLAFILENLYRLVASSKKGRIPQVQSLRSNLQFLNDFLNKVNRNPIEDETLKVLVREIRVITFVAEDVMDELILERAKNKGSGREKQAWDHLKKMSELEITRIKRLVHEYISITRKDAEDGSKKPKKLTPKIEKENVVGFQEDVHKVIHLLTNSMENLQVISIVGMPDIGKTTLANMIFSHYTIEREFDKRVWVYISDAYSRREVFLHILGQFGNLVRNDKYSEPKDLAAKINKNLENEKYLIVLDDVRTEKDWDDLKLAFPLNDKRSRILITSCYTNVARYANPQVEPYNLRFLNFDESWTLLKKKALGREDCPLELEKYGKRIAGECKGLPLAILEMGRILVEVGTQSHDWEIVSKSVEKYIAHHLPGTMDYIKSRFCELPSHLKACFIYFGMFPQDYNISVRKLIRLWIAEGFIQPKANMMKLEDIAESYLEALVIMNLVMVRKSSTNGKIKTCYVPDNIHAFCKMKAREEKSYHQISRSNQFSDSFSNDAFNMFRGLSIHPHILNKISPQRFGPRLRSFLCFTSDSDDEITASLAKISSIIRTWTFLRVLDAEPLHFTHFPSDLSQLLNLRYLVLAIQFETVPKQITSLSNLQTLMVNTSLNKLAIEGEISELCQLRRLETNAPTSFSSLSREGKRGSLIKLSTLSTISPETCIDNVFDMAPKLKKLGICGQLAKLFEVKGKRSLFDNVKMLDHLENLKLIDDIVLDVQYCKVKIVSFPTEFPPYLRKLTLEGTELDWKHMSTLEKLERLEILKLKEYAFKGETWKIADNRGFPILKVLVIERTDLTTWVASAHHFRNLRSLHLRHCASLEAVPSNLAYIVCLHVMELHWTNRQAATSAKEIQGRKGMEFQLSIYPPHHA